MKLLLIGMMGVGKSTVGRLVADRLGWAFSDSDAEVQRMTGRSVPDILREDGEQTFRAAEATVLGDALKQAGNAVVAVAGGAVLDPANRALLKGSGTVVWLRAEVVTLSDRVGDGAGRPLLDGGPQEALARLTDVRRPYYEELADVIVDVDELDSGRVADRILDAVRNMPLADT